MKKQLTRNLILGFAALAFIFTLSAYDVTVPNDSLEESVPQASAFDGESNVISSKPNEKTALSTRISSPPTPTGFTITNGAQYGSHPNFTWNASSGATGYYIYACDASEQCSKTGSNRIAGSLNTSWTDYGAIICGGGGVSCGYYGTLTAYYVTAWNGSGESSMTSPMIVSITRYF